MSKIDEVFDWITSRKRRERDASRQIGGMIDAGIASGQDASAFNQLGAADCQRTFRLENQRLGLTAHRCADSRADGNIASTYAGQRSEHHRRPRWLRRNQ